MELKCWVDTVVHETCYALTITDEDLLTLNRDIINNSKLELDYFSRKDASIEERLMGLQILARAIEEKVIA